MRNNIYHAGVLGMRWGHRKAKTSGDSLSSNTSKKEKETKKNVKNLS